MTTDLHDPEHDTRVQQAAQQLTVRLGTLCARLNNHAGGLSTTSLHSIMELVREHRRAVRARGIPFPELVPLVVPRLGAVDLVRRDLEPAGVGAALRNLVTKYPAVTTQELAQAVAWAFPQYRRGGLVNVEPARKPANDAQH